MTAATLPSATAPAVCPHDWPDYQAPGVESDIHVMCDLCGADGELSDLSTEVLADLIREHLEEVLGA